LPSWSSILLSLFALSLLCTCALQATRCAHIHRKRDKQPTIKYKTQVALTFCAHRHTEFSCSNVSLCYVCVCGRTYTTLPLLFPVPLSFLLHWRESVIWFHVCSCRSSSIIIKKKNAFLWIYLRDILTWRTTRLESQRIRLESSLISK